MSSLDPKSKSMYSSLITDGPPAMPVLPDAFGTWCLYLQPDENKPVTQFLPLLTIDYNEAFETALEIIATDPQRGGPEPTTADWMSGWQVHLRYMWGQKSDQAIVVENTPDREQNNIWTITWKDLNGTILYEKICSDTIGEDAECIADSLRKMALLSSDERSVCLQMLHKGEIDPKTWMTCPDPVLPRPYEVDVNSSMKPDNKASIYMGRITAKTKDDTWHWELSLKTNDSELAKKRLRCLDTAVREWRSIDREIHFNWDCDHSPAVDGRKKCSTCRRYRNLEDFPANSHKCLSCTERQKKRYRQQQDTAEMLQNTQRLAEDLPEILTRLSEETDSN